MVAHIKEKLEGFKENLPLISAMLNPGMRERHWKVLAERGCPYCRISLTPVRFWEPSLP